MISIKSPSFGASQISDKIAFWFTGYAARKLVRTDKPRERQIPSEYFYRSRSLKGTDIPTGGLLTRRTTRVGWKLHKGGMDSGVRQFRRNFDSLPPPPCHLL